MIVNFKLNNERAVIPAKATPGSAGYDIFSAEDVVINPRERKLVDTGFSMAFDGPCYARIAPRSGLAVKGIDVGAGVIDSDYRGPVKVLLINNGEGPFPVKVGARVAQLIFERIVRVQPVCCLSLDETERGEGGFGSTGDNVINGQPPQGDRSQKQVRQLNTYNI